MIYLLFLAFLIIYTYILVICCLTKRIPSSISRTYYFLPNKWIFTVLFYLTAIFTVIPALEYTLDNYRFLIFLAMAALGFVGSAPDYAKGDKLELHVHEWAAIVYVLASQIWCSLVLSPWLMLTWLLPIGYLVYLKIKKIKRNDIIFWGEITSILTIFITLLSIVH